LPESGLETKQTLCREWIAHDRWVKVFQMFNIGWKVRCIGLIEKNTQKVESLVIMGSQIKLRIEMRPTMAKTRVGPLKSGETM
jgi:hypothetical protein